jgi:hypothetical protein
MTQQTNKFGCGRGEHRRSARLWSVAFSGVSSLPRIAKDTGGVIAPSGPPG